MPGTIGEDSPNKHKTAGDHTSSYDIGKLTNKNDPR